MKESRSCLAYLISTPASGVGKNTIVIALTKYYSEQGLKFRVFKNFPDFLVPKILEKGLWMVGKKMYADILLGSNRCCFIVD